MKLGRAALVTGVAIGVIIPALTFGTGVTHVVCSRGSLLGWSEPLATPEAIGLPPPGGEVTYRWWLFDTFENPFVRDGLGGGPTTPDNFSRAYYDVTNWTLFAINTEHALGWGSSIVCQSYMLGLGGIGNQSIPWGGCAGCVVAAPTAAGIGNRLVIPTQVQYGTLNTTILDATYGPVPNGSFAWKAEGGGVNLTGPSGLSGLPVTFAPYFEGNQLFGLAITIRQTIEQLEIPIHLLKGGIEDVPGSYPVDWDPSGNSTVNYWDNNTYILPLSDDQGSWDVYVPGAGSEFGIPGLLFVQTGD